MTSAIIITICVLLLLAYLFDFSSSRTRIPSVILLLLLGYIVREVTVYFGITVPDLNRLLPVLGTVGLILIVMEGSLELELNRSKLPFVGKTLLMSLLPIILFSFGLAFAFRYFADVSLKTGLANAIPFAVISSSVAIPSAQNLSAPDREFITYESSLSDIFGVILFNFIVLNESISIPTFGHFFVELAAIMLISLGATLGLAWLLSRIRHHVKYAPIILCVILIYAVSKIYHLPALIFILLFGLFLGNLQELRSWKFIQRLRPEVLSGEVHKFRDLTVEITFLIRALFFILFGFLINPEELFSGATVLWAGSLCFGIFLIRALLLKVLRLELLPLLFVAPRGLITILLFLSVPGNQAISLAGKSLVIQVIILSALIMMAGLMISSKKESAGLVQE